MIMKNDISVLFIVVVLIIFKYQIKCEREICMGVYNGEPKVSHCKAHTDRTRIFYRTCELKQ